MVMGERIKRTTRPETVKVERSADTSNPEAEATDAERDAAAAMDAPVAGDNPHRGGPGVGRS